MGLETSLGLCAFLDKDIAKGRGTCGLSSQPERAGETFFLVLRTATGMMKKCAGRTLTMETCLERLVPFRVKQR